MKTVSYGECRQSGFTLVELITVIALAGIVAVMIATVMSRPLQGFVDQSRRAELTDLAATALNRMARDIRLAVPNSVRNESNCPALGCRSLELLAISEGGRYRANQWGGIGDRYDPPRCPESDECNIPVLSPGMDANKVAEARWMMIYSTGQVIGNAGGPTVITPDSVRFALGCTSDEPCLDLTGTEAAGFSFQYASPQHRFYLVRDVLGYRCENPGKNSSGNGNGSIRRGVFDTLSGTYTYTNAPLVVDSVSACSFTYDPGTNTRNGLVTLRLSLTKDGETITLLQQVHVDNAP
ncbi:PulJ/GspJ family protein [Stutzerimonas nitrititolerans]|uniref:PulJ/GspJ family protein n=1 Tax=Stutzerimonas nitrititolerans TaxID=2482751 RepID=UPI0028AFA41B|nr:type II secretion system protein [Stutzerimonas nitrititolerans]